MVPHGPSFNDPACGAGILRLDRIWEQFGGAYNSLSWACRYTSFKIVEPGVGFDREDPIRGDPIRTWSKARQKTDVKIGALVNSNNTGCFVKEDVAGHCCHPSQFVSITIDFKTKRVHSDAVGHGLVSSDGYFSFDDIETLSRCVAIRNWRGIGGFNDSSASVNDSARAAGGRVAYRASSKTVAPQPKISSSLTDSFRSSVINALTKRVPEYMFSYGAVLLRTERVCVGLWNTGRNLTSVERQANVCSKLEHMAMEMAEAASLNGSQPIAIISDLHLRGGTALWSTCRPCVQALTSMFHKRFRVLPGVCDTVSNVSSGVGCGLAEMTVASKAFPRIRLGHSQLHQFINNGSASVTGDGPEISLTFAGGWVTRTPTLRWRVDPRTKHGSMVAEAESMAKRAKTKMVRLGRQIKGGAAHESEPSGLARRMRNTRQTVRTLAMNSS